MGLFREAGRQVEQLKQSVTGDDDAEDAERDGDYECESCGARFDTHEGECPECWAEEVTQTAP